MPPQAFRLKAERVCPHTKFGSREIALSCLAAMIRAGRDYKVKVVFCPTCKYWRFSK